MSHLPTAEKEVVKAALYITKSSNISILDDAFTERLSGWCY
jgi:hypothetical protein